MHHLLKDLECYWSQNIINKLFMPMINDLISGVILFKATCIYILLLYYLLYFLKIAVVSLVQTVVDSKNHNIIFTW
jgi:hypothetical protein